LGWIETESVKEREAKHGDKEPKKTEEHPAAHNVGRRFETYERICEFLFLSFAVLLSVVNTHKVLIAGCAICAGILAFCFWYDDRQIRRDATAILPTLHLPSPMPSTSTTVPPPAPASAASQIPPHDTPSPTSVPTAPTSEKISPKPAPTSSPNASEIALTPTQIFQKIENASSFNKDDVRAAFAGLSVDWTLFFVSASRRGEDMRIFFRDKEGAMAMCDVPLKGNERFPLKDRMDRFRVRATIEEVAILAIYLKDSSIDQIQ
jgi:hypothetical protein